MPCSVQAVCDSYDIPLAAAALQFSLRDPKITVTITGMSKPERIGALELASLDIPGALWDEIDALGPPDTGDPAP